VLASALVLVLAGLILYAQYNERQYLAKLQAEIGNLEPVARHADALDVEIQQDGPGSSCWTSFATRRAPI